MKLKLKAGDPVTEELVIALVKTINRQQQQINELEELALELRLKYAKTQRRRRKRTKHSQSLLKVFKG